MGEELQFLCAFFLHTGEVGFVCSPDVGDESKRGLDDVAQTCHFSRTTDASLEDADATLRIEQPHREWNANLRIERSGRTCHLFGWAKELIEPFFDNRLTIRPRDADNGQRKLRTVGSCQLLQCVERRFDTEKMDFVFERLRAICCECLEVIVVIDHKIANSTLE